MRTSSIVAMSCFSTRQESLPCCIVVHEPCRFVFKINVWSPMVPYLMPYPSIEAVACVIFLADGICRQDSLVEHFFERRGPQFLPLNAQGTGTYKIASRLLRDARDSHTVRGNQHNICRSSCARRQVHSRSKKNTAQTTVRYNSKSTAPASSCLITCEVLAASSKSNFSCSMCCWARQLAFSSSLDLYMPSMMGPSG